MVKGLYSVKKSVEFETGQSYLLNESTIGDSPHWDDPARDIIHMINVFQDQMPPPLIAMGQSWGGYPIVQAALYHPRLFTAIVPLEPFIGSGGGRTPANFTYGVTFLMAHRRDKWPSLDTVRKSFLKNPYFAKFDKDVFEKVMENDFRHHPDGGVELITPKMQEVTTMIRKIPSVHSTTGADVESQKEYLGLNNQLAIPGFYRAEPGLIGLEIRKLSCAVLYMFGSESVHMFEGLRVSLLKETGTAPGASGGVKTGMVDSAIVSGSGHPMPLEKPRETAEAMVPWLNRRIRNWGEEVDRVESGEMWTKEVDPRWLKAIPRI
jgi:pimeloyl-ACP methyl ester carboxylesterase